MRQRRRRELVWLSENRVWERGEELKKEGRKKEKEVWASLTIAEESFFIVQKFVAVLTGCGRRRTDRDEEMTVCTLLFSLFTLSFPLSSPLLILLLLLEAKKDRQIINRVNT